MKVSKIEIDNFKSFDNLSINLKDLNIIVGGCSSGKSNFIEFFKFLKDFSEDFEKGVNNHGGPYLKNFLHANDNDVSRVKIYFKKQDDENINYILNNDTTNTPENSEISLNFNNFDYELSIAFDDNNYSISKEVLNIEFDVIKINNNSMENNESTIISNNSINLINNFGEITANLKHMEKYFSIDDLIPKQLLNIAENNFKKDSTPLINSALSTVPFSWALNFKKMKFYDFNPKIVKSIHEINGNNNLGEYGQNLSLVLEKIISNQEEYRELLNLINYILPYIENINVDTTLDKQRIFTVTETFTDKIIPSVLSSDGTVNIIALICALYFEKGNIILIEEPERHIHPELFVKIVSLMKEISQEKQIIVTTHSPEILRNNDLDNIYLISRDNSGVSEISKPITNEAVKPFIEELGIEEVFIDGYLGLKNE